MASESTPIDRTNRPAQRGQDNAFLTRAVRRRGERPLPFVCIQKDDAASTRLRRVGFEFEGRMPMLVIELGSDDDDLPPPNSAVGPVFGLAFRANPFECLEEPPMAFGAWLRELGAGLLEALFVPPSSLSAR